MRAPVKSEADAFWLVVATVAVLLVAVLVGHLLAPVAGVGVVVAAVFGWLMWDVGQGEEPPRLREAEQAGHRAGRRARRLVLVVVNATAPGRLLAEAILRPGVAPPVLEVLAPVLQSRTHFVTTDIDRETHEAWRRVNNVIGWADEYGVAAHGRVGDAIDPIGGLADELRRYDVDEVVLVDHPADSANWVETTLRSALREQSRLPIRELVVTTSPSERPEVALEI